MELLYSREDNTRTTYHMLPYIDPIYIISYIVLNHWWKWSHKFSNHFWLLLILSMVALHNLTVRPYCWMHCMFWHRTWKNLASNKMEASFLLNSIICAKSCCTLYQRRKVGATLLISKFCKLQWQTGCNIWPIMIWMMWKTPIT